MTGSKSTVNVEELPHEVRNTVLEKGRYAGKTVGEIVQCDLAYLTGLDCAQIKGDNSRVRDAVERVQQLASATVDESADTNESVDTGESEGATAGSDSTQ